ncbi:piggyBac transposable element-derived protein 3-like [Nilaparvata lugens]|uniref:piggyBac transposable element-derived protein 3-like n=1 Tax=Nilaparvata lugens TaxID=108931 RepID=UPI00193E1E66|nr:piggyBac transposable element-derived protein 3-like [Nilaparvata lugens]
MSDCASTMTDRNRNRYDSSNLNCIRLTDLTLQEAIDILECDDADDVQGIFIEPPAPNIDTDEDSGDEDGGGYVDNLTGRQLTSQVEVVTNSRNDTSVLDNTFEDLSSSTRASSSSTVGSTSIKQLLLLSLSLDDNVITTIAKVLPPPSFIHIYK